MKRDKPKPIKVLQAMYEEGMDEDDADDFISSLSEDS